MSEILTEGREHFPIKGCEFWTDAFGPHVTIIRAKVMVGEQVFTGSSVLVIPNISIVPTQEYLDTLLVEAQAALGMQETLAFQEALTRAGIYRDGAFILPEKTTESSITDRTVPAEALDETPGGSCEDCGKDIYGYWAGTLRVSGVKVAELTEGRHGRALCANCSRKVVKGKLVK